MKLSIEHRKKKSKGIGKKIKDKTPRSLGPAVSTVHTCGDGRTGAVTVRWRASGSTVNIPWDSSTEDGLVRCKRPCTQGGRKVPKSISKIDRVVEHVCRKHNQEADHWANIGAQ